MMRNRLRIPRPMAVWAMCVIVIFTYCGCTPLKKKFIRQKKKDKETSSDFIPVLEPEIYPVKTASPADTFAQQYTLLKIWVSDFADNYETIGNDKRMVGDLNSALKAVDEMIGQLASASSEDLTALKKQIVWVRDEFEKPSSFRNISRINSELRDVQRNIKKFKPGLVAEHIKDQ